MPKKIVLILLLGIITLMLAGCGDDSGSLNPVVGPIGRLTAAIPPGAVLESATLNLYVWQPSSQTVNIHRITDYWDEMTVTWNSFGGAYSANVDATVFPVNMGWISADVTPLVQAWLDGTYTNHGFLLEQGITRPRSIFLSREHVDYPPYLEVCYNDGSGTVCEQIPAAADSYIWALNPDDNWGSSNTLRTGLQIDVDWEKQAMIRFDLPLAPPPDCGPCDGKITDLTLAYNGAAEAMIDVYSKGKHGQPGDLLYSGMVVPGGTFNFIGTDNKGTMGTEISIYVDGVLNTKIHTSCSQPIYIGMISGDFEIVDGYSRNGGRLCPDTGNNGGDECSECDGKITELTLEYTGMSEALIEVYSKGKHNNPGDLLYSGSVMPNGTFNFIGMDKKGTMGTEISIFVDGDLNTRIHTSCSQPIYIGMTSGDFVIVDGYSRNGGQLCSTPTGGNNGDDDDGDHHDDDDDDGDDDHHDSDDDHHDDGDHDSDHDGGCGDD